MLHYNILKTVTLNLFPLLSKIIITCPPLEGGPKSLISRWGQKVKLLLHFTPPLILRENKVFRKIFPALKGWGFVSGHIFCTRNSFCELYLSIISLKLFGTTMELVSGSYRWSDSETSSK